VTLMVLILFMQAHAGAVASHLRGTHILVVVDSPRNEPNKDRIKPSLKDDGKRKRDEEERLSGDANFWQFDFDVELPEGRKQLKFTIEIDGKRQPLRDNNPPRPLVNDEGGALNGIGEDHPYFKAALTKNSTAFIPAVSGTYRFDMPRDAMLLSTFAFMTTGAQNDDIVIKELRVDVWPRRPSSSHLREHQNNKEVPRYDFR